MKKNEKNLKISERRKESFGEKENVKGLDRRDFKTESNEFGAKQTFCLKKSDVSRNKNREKKLVKNWT